MSVLADECGEKPVGREAQSARTQVLRKRAHALRKAGCDNKIDRHQRKGQRVDPGED